MSTRPLLIRKAAVLGAGVMGAQIAAHLANAGIPVVLFDLAAKEGDPNGLVTKAIAGLAKLEPAPLGVKDRAASIDAANYGSDLPRLADCDLVIEAIAERLDWKRDLYEKIAPHVPRARRARVQYLRPFARGAVGGGSRGASAALLRHPFLQSAAVHVPGRNHRCAGNRRRRCWMRSRHS